MFIPRPLLLIALCFASILLPTAARADLSADLLDKLKTAGFKCTATPDLQGSFCLKTGGQYSLYVIVPAGLSNHFRNVFYAHGLLRACGPGLSGENYLKNQSPKLRQIGAVAVLPVQSGFYENSPNFSWFFPLDSLIPAMNNLLGTAPWDLVAHSGGGEVLATSLVNSPVTLQQVDQILLLDAVFNVKDVAPLWNRILGAKPGLEIRFISSTTAAKARELAKILDNDPRLKLEDTGKEEHCHMPTHFQDL
jgi:hypothetical protein